MRWSRRQKRSTGTPCFVGSESVLAWIGICCLWPLTLTTGLIPADAETHSRSWSTGDTAEWASEFAQLVTEVFLNYHRERNARRIEQEIASVSERIEAAQREAEEARRLYNEFRERNGIADLSSEQRSTVSSAAEWRVDSEFAAAEARALEARIRSLEEQLAETPKTSMVGGGVSPEREAYNRLRQELVSARASLSPDHPRVQALEHQVAQLRSQIRSGGGGESVVGSNSAYVSLTSELREAKSELTTVLARQRGLADMAEKAQQRMDSFSGRRGRGLDAPCRGSGQRGADRSLARNRGGSRGRARESSKRLFRPGSRLGSGASDCRTRRSRSFSLRSRSSASSLGLVFVFWREFAGLRLQTPAEIAFWGSGPVLAATPWPIDPLGLDEVVAGLDDLAPDANGTLLILAASPEDAPLARDFARRVNEDWFVDGPMAAAPAGRVSVPRQQTPLTTPPPSGPYPIGGSARQSAAPARPSTALALRPVQLVRRDQHIRLEAWDGPFEGQSLRRAARLADRVIVLVRSNGTTAIALHGVHRRVGRQDGIGFVVLALPPELESLPDRVGNVVGFWKV